MAKPEPEIQHRVFEADKSRAGVFGWPIGLGGAALVMLLIPISQFLTTERPPPMEIAEMEIAMPPPPPPVEPEPPPPEPEEQQEPPELDTPPPQLSLDQLDLALTPGSGGDLTADFGLGNFDVSQDTLGGIGEFSVEDLDSKPGLRNQVKPKFSRAFMKTNKGKTLLARIEFIINQDGRVEKPKVMMTTIPGTEDKILSAMKRWRYDSPKKDGVAVRVKYVQPLRFTIE